MSPTQNKALIRRFFDEVWNNGRVDLAAEFIAEGYISHTTIDDLIAEGDRVVVREPTA